MLEFITFLVQLGFVLFMAIALGTLFFSLLLAWSAAQNLSNRTQTRATLSEILTRAGVEWGALMTLFFCQFVKLQAHFDVPKFEKTSDVLGTKMTDLPIILIPSLNWNASIFSILFWRLRQHYCKSLWPFSWKFFLKDPDLMEDQLRRFILSVIEQTGSSRLIFISFGTSRPILARVLKSQKMKHIETRWIGISAPSQLGSALQFLASPRVLKAYEKTQNDVIPDVLITGLKDSLCYPRDEVFKHPQLIEIPNMGHYGALMHSKGIQVILEELESEKFKKQQIVLEQGQ